MIIIKKKKKKNYYRLQIIIRLQTDYYYRQPYNMDSN